MTAPQVLTDPLYQLLYNENIAEFNRRHDEAKSAMLHGGSYRGLDLREINADGLDFSDAYFHGADLRGIDFRKTNLEGASMIDAKISGCYFPKELSAEEIRLSIMAGTRMRYTK
ncbi:MAG TPA: pentapeptide repeat-containing protein [Spongiibacteraceae bacterium]|jgi:uncharacterized protein YjbI with pentapeptide repeats